MLRVTGLITGINGQDDASYNEEYVKLETLAKQLGHPIPQSYQHFALSSSQMHKNHITGHQHRSEGVRVMARQEMTVRGSQVVIEYVEGLKKKREGNVVTEVAHPRKIMVSERSLKGAVSTKTEWNKEKAFYLSLIPSCQTSPFHVPSQHVARYLLQDPRVQAKKQLEGIMGRWDAVKKIQDDELSEIRMMIIAAGMGLQSKGMDISQIKASLMLRADQNSKRFVDEFYSKSIMALGLVNLCRQLNIVKFVGKSGQFYLAIDETLASLTNNTGIEILNGGYESQRLGISALTDAVSQNDKAFQVLLQMLDKAMKDGHTGVPKTSSQIAAAEANVDNLFAIVENKNLSALAGAGENVPDATGGKKTPDAKTEEGNNDGKKSDDTKVTNDPPPVLNE